MIRRYYFMSARKVSTEKGEGCAYGHALFQYTSWFPDAQGAFNFGRDNLTEAFSETYDGHIEILAFNRC